MFDKIKNLALSEKVIVLLSITLLILIGYKSYYQEKPTAMTANKGEVVPVVLTDTGYEPAELNVKVGTEIVFSTERGKPHWPASNLHPTHEQYPEFDPKKPLEPNEEWSFVVDQAGRWDFHDHIRSYYVGTIYVTEE